MGPSVKFVSCSNGSFSKKKENLGSFFFRKKTKPGGGGVEGSLAKGYNFYMIFWQPSLTVTTNHWHGCY